MIHKIGSFLSFSIIALLFSSCTKNDVKSVAIAPATPVLTATSTAVVLQSINAGTHIAITNSWNVVDYGVSTPEIYTLQIDSLNGDFSSPYSITATNLQQSFTDSALNILALKFKLVPNKAGQLKFRLMINLSPSGAMIVYSNVLNITVTPYINLVLMFPMPTALYLQGDAVASNWGYPITSAQQLTQIDSHRFGLIVKLTGGKSFDFILSATGWTDPAYKAATASQPAIGGSFVASGSTSVPAWGGNDFTAPATTGTYQIIADFSTGTYTVTPAAMLTIPAALYLQGDAVASNWGYPITASQQLTATTDPNVFKVTVPLIGGKHYDIITSSTSYSDPAFKAATGADVASAGNFIASGSATTPAWGGSDIASPATSGTYTITVNFKAGTYVVSQ